MEFSRSIGLIGSILFGTTLISAQQIAGIQSSTQRIFVTSVTPVVGPNGVVGGISVDAAGVVSRAEVTEMQDLARARAAALQKVPTDLEPPTPMRMVSLKRLDRAVEELIELGESPTEEMFFLAGLQRVEYVFLDPKAGDIVLAGPAEGWFLNDRGEVVGRQSGQPVLRLDDLIDAFSMAASDPHQVLTCSIEPTEGGLKRYAELTRRRRIQFNPQTVAAIENAIGPQQVLIEGVKEDSHYARVMVAADFMMKRIAMGFEPSQVNDLPSYLQLLRRQPPAPQMTSPRWWMAAQYDTPLRSPDGLAWQIRGPGIRTLTEDSLLTENGQRVDTKKPNLVAQGWADSMTENFRDLSSKFPVFGELRNCIDLSVTATLIAKRDLWTASGCELHLLHDHSRIRGPIYDVPKQIDSKATFLKARRGWIVSVSGGVEVNAWSFVESFEDSQALDRTRRRALRPSERWWW